MHSDYCYPGSDVLINKLNITNSKDLFDAELELTSIRLQELQENPLKGDFDFLHLKAIHKYIFQDIYEWAGKERTVELGKGNLFCLTRFIQDYANSVFSKYHTQCYAAKDNFENFIQVFSKNYSDVNALHPFREGNGRTQREFARLICLDCGYDFNLSCTTHKEMLEASISSFDKGDLSGFINIFTRAIYPYQKANVPSSDTLSILSSDDLLIGISEGYDYYNYDEHQDSPRYAELYKERIQQMNDEMQNISPNTKKTI